MERKKTKRKREENKLIRGKKGRRGKNPQQRPSQRRKVRCCLKEESLVVHLRVFKELKKEEFKRTQ